MRILPVLPILASALVFAGTAGAAGPASSTVSADVADSAPAAASREPDPAAVARMEQAARAGRFGETFKRALRNSPANAMRDRVLALDGKIIEGVFARIVATRFDAAEADAIAAFYLSPDGEALAAAQLAGEDAPALTPAQREAIAAFFATPTGRKFNAVLADKATLDELQLALAFVAGPAG